MLSLSDTLAREARAAITEAQRRAYVTDRNQYVVRRGSAVHIVEVKADGDNVLAVAWAGGAPSYVN